MEDSQSFVSDLYQFALGISAGVITTILTTKWLNKEILLTKRLFIQRVAYSSESETWGKIEVLYNGGQSHNLHLITVDFGIWIIQDYCLDQKCFELEMKIAVGIIGLFIAWFTFKKRFFPSQMKK